MNHVSMCDPTGSGSRVARLSDPCWLTAWGGWLAALLFSSNSFGLSAAMAADPSVELGTSSTPAVDFARTVFPILQERCVECHGPEKQKSGLRLDGRQAALAGGKSGAGILPHKPAESALLARVSSNDPDEVMPPKGDRLTPNQVASFRAWIEHGAVWPEGVGAQVTAPRKHWAYEPPIHRDPPQVRHRNWARQPLDAFVLARLEREHLSPSPEADRATLLRRVTLDLTGLPPTVAELDAFLKDHRKGAYERVVDRLLASPHYGERWARPWLDLARYADTNGYEADQRRSNWLYRDWVIEALNQDMPFDEFTIEQLAGDLLPSATVDQRIATGFHRNTMVNTEGGTDDEEFRVAAVIDRVNTTFEVWMGTTMGCCQCHSHKYDPFTQKEYYRLFAFLNQTKDTGRENKPQLEVPTPAQAAKRAELKAKIEPLQKTLDTSTPALEEAQTRWEAAATSNRVAIGESWVTLAPTAMSASGGVTLGLLADQSVLAGGPSTDTNVYELTAQTSAETLTALRIETLADEHQPEGGAGRSAKGNFVLTEVEIEARPLVERPIAQASQPQLGPWHVIGPFQAGSMEEAFKKDFPPEKELNLAKTYEDGKLRWVEKPEWADGTVHPLAGENVATYLHRTITAREAAPLLVSLGSDDGIQVWLNGEKLLSKNVARAAAADQETVRLDLTEGENHLLLKINNGGGGYGFYFAVSQDQSGIYRWDLAEGYSDVSEPKFEAKAAFDGDAKTGWTGGDLDATNRANHYAVFALAKPVHCVGGAGLKVRLRQESPLKEHLLGRFRLSLSTARPEAHAAWARLPLATRKLLEIPRDKLSEEQRKELAAYYRSIDPALDPVRMEIAELKKQEPKDVISSLVLEAVDKPRTTYFLKRGSFMNKGEEVTPGVPAVLHPLPPDQPLDRLSFARWVASPDNPLVGRVTMNRVWSQYFGRGLVETSDDFGLQGEPPSHPELLDWLATEWVRQKWSLKAMHRILVTSATYRQSSAVSADLAVRDPFNRLLARGPRFRMEAEMLRDYALAVSGLLNPKIGGPSVFPYQPEGVWSNPYSEDKWVVSKDGDQFRRGLYTFWRRTAPYASFMVFDAPSREVSCERRPRTNTPLQALATLNDPAFTAAAVALARKIVADGGRTDRERLVYAFRRCLGRAPTRDEERVLTSLWKTARDRFIAEPDKAKATLQILPGEAHGDPADVAAWFVVANALLNLDETLTKG